MAGHFAVFNIHSLASVNKKEKKHTDTDTNIKTIKTPIQKTIFSWINTPKWMHCVWKTRIKNLKKKKTLKETILINEKN